MAELPPHVVPSTAAPLAVNSLPTPPSLPVQLLIAQAVSKLGTAASWQSISQLLDQSEDWPASAPKMTTNGLEQAFVDMMRVRSLDPAACTEPQARPARKLIHSLYTNLLITLRDSLLSGHAQEMKLKSEISQIQSGQVDNLLIGSAPQIVKDRFQATQLLDAQAAQAQVQAQLVQQHSASPPMKPSEASLPLPEDIKGPEGDASTSTGQTKSGSSPARRSGRKNSRQEDETQRTASSPRGDGVEPAEDTPMAEPDVGLDGGEDGVGSIEVAEKEGKKEKKGRKPAAGRKARKKGGRRKKESEPESEVEGEEGEQEVEEEDATGNDKNLDEEVEQEQEQEQEQDKAVDEEEEEDAEEEEDSKKRTGRKRAGVRTGARSNKRKASAPPTPAVSGSPSAEVERSATPAAKRRKGRKSKADVDAEQEGLGSTEPKESKALTSKRKAAFTRIVDSIRSLPFSNSFESKITRSIAPNYQAAVKRPMCLKDIGKKIKSGEIKDSSELMRDFAILCANAVQFNGDEGEGSVGRQAKELWMTFERLMDETLSTEFNMENTGS